ncbi:MAG: 30S ribosomal protein S9 [Chloroflexota bacterium]|nr:30S ribosomal protein S9 [SAR202 cluster bacterium]GIT15683.1 MAG: 30S ribosomal protein S9 [Chloroflexota bacterium]
MVEQERYFYAVGRRKTSIARVKLYKGKDGAGVIIINGKPLEEVFSLKSWRDVVNRPFYITDTSKSFRVVATTTGGGVVSQASAIRHGISRALVLADNSLRSSLKKDGLLTRDSREKESKKYGLKRARKAQQWTKR